MSGIIIQMNSKEFLKQFVDLKGVVLKDFNYILVSDEINSKGGMSNVVRAKELIPKTVDVGLRINGRVQEYYKNYMEYLSSPTPLHLIATMIKGVMESNLNVILLCSKSEDENMYLEFIAEYMDRNFGVKVYSYDEYEAESNRHELNSIVDEARTKKAMVSAIEYLKIAFEANKKEQDKKDKSKVKEELKDMKKKELKEICEEYGIKFKKDDDKKDIIKKILKEMFK